MPYEHIPDHLKKRTGRPRKYDYGYTERSVNGRTKKQAAEELRGVPIIQLDYYTGEYYGEYPSITQCADDLDISISTILGSFCRNGSISCVARLPKHELLLIRKSAFDALRGSIPNE